MGDSYLEFQALDTRKILVAIDRIEPSLTERASTAEVTRSIVHAATVGFDTALGVVTAVAESFAQQFDHCVQKPKEMELSFGLEVNADLSVFAIAKAGGKTSFSVKIKWTSSDG